MGLSGSPLGAAVTRKPNAISFKVSGVVDKSDQRDSSAFQRLAYAARTSGVSRAGSTEKDTNRTERPRNRRWSATMLAVTIGHALVHSVNMKSTTKGRPRSESSVTCS
jgi:hypothetical protein